MYELLGYKFDIPGAGGKFKKLFSKPKVGKTGKLLKTTETIPLDQILPFSPLFCRLVDYSTLDTKGGLEVLILLLRQVIAMNSYRLPEYMFATNKSNSEPGWAKLLRQLVGAS